MTTVKQTKRHRTDDAWMLDLAKPQALTADQAEEEIIFSSGIQHGDYWAGTVVRPVVNAPSTAFVFMEIHQAGRVVEQRTAGERRLFMQAVWKIAPADQWSKKE